MLSKRKTLLMVAVIVLALTACSKGENKSAEREVEKKPQQTGKVYDKFPLTGKEAEGGPEGRAVAVMINNHPAARPQSGLSEADIVYEALAEGEVTRLLAIYQSQQPENIGPVRSARDYFIELAQGYDSLYVAHGYSPDAQKMLTSGEFDNLNGIQYDGTLFKRSSARKAPHNSYISFESIKEGASNLGYGMDKAPREMHFLDGEALSIEGTESNYMRVTYGKTATFTAEYKYDEKTEKYTRYSDGEQTTDMDTEKPVLLDNVIVMELNHQVIDDAGRRAIDLTSGGRAFLLEKGVSYEVEWKNEDGRLIPYLDNEPIGLIPGKTWINIVPEMNVVSFEQ